MFADFIVVNFWFRCELYYTNCQNHDTSLSKLGSFFSKKDFTLHNLS